MVNNIDKLKIERIVTMTRNEKKQKLKIASINYIHDPDAAEKWFNLYVQLIKEKIEKSHSE
jgi:hypothetical protein